MIASVRGTALSVGLDSAVVEVGGVGLLLSLSPGTAAALRPGGEARLATSLVVREDSLTLFGFADEEERAVFEMVQTVSGVGPRLALAMLAVLTPAEVRAALSGGDLHTLTKVPGIGRKGAERLVLELREKSLLLAATGVVTPPSAPAPEPEWRGQVREALVGLGWSARHVDEALDRVAAKATATADGGGPAGSSEGVGSSGTVDVSAVLRDALRELGR